VSEDDWEPDNESDFELDNGIEALEILGCRDVSAIPIVPGSNQPTRRSIKQSEKGFMMVSAMEARRSRANKRMWDRMGHYVITRFNVLLDQEYHLEK